MAIVTWARSSFATLAFVALFATTPAQAQDANGNFTQDSSDLRNGTSIDCNHNGHVDDAELDRSHFICAVEHLNTQEQFTSYVLDIAPIDFNADGRMDLAAISYPDPNYGYVTLWRNDGGVGLTYLSRFTLGTQLGRIIAVNIVGDERTDLVISDTSFTRVYVLRATGSATFAAPMTLTGDTSNNGLGGLAVGDLDNDGDIDVAASCWGAHTCNVWKNNGNGTFGPKASTAVGYNPRGLAIRDLTGDGFADIAVANSWEYAPPPVDDGKVTILRNSGTGTFALHATYTMPQNTGPYGIMRPCPKALALTDTDHDGDTDMIVSSAGSERLDLWVNSGTGNFTLFGSIGAGYSLGNVASGVAVRDLDGDSWEDVVWADADSNSVSVYKNTTGTFTFRQHFGTGNYGTVNIATADFDGDGRADIVAANHALRTFSILRNNGDLLFEAPPRLRPSEFPGTALLVDFTGDGRADLGTPTQTVTTATGFSVHPGRGDGSFGAAINTPGVPSGIISPRDINHDGKFDLFIGYGMCQVCMGNGDGTFGAAIVSPLSVLLRHVVIDINADGHHDVLWISPGHPGALYRSLGDGAGHFAPAVVVAVVPAEDEEIASGDLDGDGLAEIFTGHRQGLEQPGGIFCVYPNIGGGSFGARQDRFIGATPFSPAVGAIVCSDFDGDADNDVVVAAGATRIYRNAGGGALPALAETVNDVSGSIYRADDFDLDGDIDIIARASTAIVLFNDSTGHFPKRSFAHQYSGNARGMVLGDANADGRTDVLIEPENSWDKYLFLNRPSPDIDCDANSIPDQCDPDSDGDGTPDACEPLASDLNGDGAVNAVDLVIMLVVWGDVGGAADLNSDGFVGAGDLTYLLSEWTP